MKFDIREIQSDSSHYPAFLRSGDTSTTYRQIWSIGNLDILKGRLLGFFCSTRCPGDIILRTYDVARALRDNGIPVIGGFHSPMEKECLDFLLRGNQPVVACPARSIERMRVPMAWRKPLAEGRLLVLSPFEAHHRRPTAKLAEQRNYFVTALSDALFVAYVAPGSKTEGLCLRIVEQGKPIYMLSAPENARLAQHSMVGYPVSDLLEAIVEHLNDN